MVRGLYTAASGMLVQSRLQDLIANNLANAATTGYRRDAAPVRAHPTRPLFRVGDPLPAGGALAMPSGAGLSLPAVPLGEANTGAYVDRSFIDPSSGPIAFTGEPLDLALDGDGFLAVLTPWGERYTRGGTFTLDAGGMLVTAEGYPVLGEAGPIVLPPGLGGEGGAGTGLQIGVDGQVYFGEELLGRLRLVDFPGGWPSMVKQGANLLEASPEAGDPVPAEGAAVLQGYLERSNVNVVREMVDLIQAMRAYEASQRVIRAEDETLARAVNDVGSMSRG